MEMETVPGQDTETRRISEPRCTASAWETWLGHQRLPCTERTQLIGPARRLVVVAPHPDDEVLTCGALLHGHASQGGDSLVVAVTDGEASHEGTTGYDPARLASQRRQESMEGLKRLDVPKQAIVRLGLPDGGLQQRKNDLWLRLTYLIRPADVVVTTWRRDGHPDHEACGDTAAQVCLAKGVALLEAPVWMWHWARPWDPQVHWDRLKRMPVDSEMQARKLHALAAHRSQMDPRSTNSPAVLDTTLIERAGWNAEYFFTSP